MKAAYVAGPYRAHTTRGVVENIRAAEAVAIELWRMGFAVLTPHLNSALLDGAAPDEVWLKGGLELMRRCDLVVMVQGWYDSSGAKAERGEALRLGIRVYQWPYHERALAALAEAT